MFRARLAVATLLLLSSLPAGLGGQTAFLQPGVHVRIAGIGQGTIVSRSADTLFVMTKEGVPLPLALRSLPTVEIRGDKNHGAGAVRGAGIGGVAGLLVGIAAWAAGDSTGCRYDLYTGEELGCGRKMNAGDAALAGVGGAMLGAGIGALIGRRRWTTIRIPGAEAARLYFVPGGRGALVVSLRAKSP